MIDRHQLARRLRDLGACVPIGGVEDRVYDALVRVWRGRRGLPPKLPEIAKAAGLNVGSAANAIKRLRYRDRVVVASRGVYVPIVDRSSEHANAI